MIYWMIFHWPSVEQVITCHLLGGKSAHIKVYGSTDECVTIRPSDSGKCRDFDAIMVPLPIRCGGLGTHTNGLSHGSRGCSADSQMAIRRSLRMTNKLGMRAETPKKWFSYSGADSKVGTRVRKYSTA
jgi:hypothetical protein